MIRIAFAIIVLALSSKSYSSSQKMKVRSYLQTDFDSMYEIKVFEYSKIILDCQSFFNQLVLFENNEKIIFHLSSEKCYQSHVFLYESQQKKLPTCLSLNKDLKEIELTNNDSINCK